MLFFDTCFWTHAKIVSDNKIFDFRILIDKYQFGFSPQVKKELEHYLPDYLDFTKFYSKPVSHQDFKKFQIKNPLLHNYDLADQSLIIIGLKYKDMILSDDRELIAECQNNHIKSFHLVDFSLLLVKENIITKNQTHKIIKCIVDHKIIAKKHYKLLLRKLNKIK